MTDRKKAAAIAAVAHYMKTQEEAMALHRSWAAEPWVSPEETAVIPRQETNLWGVSGRQEQMQMRAMMQMKAFSLSKRNR
jgi:hypothetical protein